MTLAAYDTSGRRKYLSRSEGLAFLAQATSRSPSEFLLCQTLYYTGCRISEALSLRPSDIDVSVNSVRVRSLKKRGKVEFRRIPIPEALTGNLVRLRLREDCRLWEYSRTTAWRMVKAVMHTAGLSGIHATCKGLRHAFGVRAALGNVPLPIIQGWMGHADSATTAIYLAVRDEEERELIERTW